ncbi:hypothetical protein HDU91_007073 [Kappamyces sp. JEL0680]|nr:hypothetical protein HDU91_007073 [Kappamyces sp. JEL0680]
MPPKDRKIKKSQYLSRRFTLLFLQYAENLKAIGLFQESEKRKVLNLDGRISVLAFSELLTSIGPSINSQQAMRFIYDYDSSLTGSLGHDDFLEFMNDYVAVIQRSRESAIRYWKTQKQLADNIYGDDGESGDHGYFNQEEGGFIDEFPTVELYLQGVGLDDPYEFLDQKIDPITEKIQNSFWIDDPCLLTRHISVRVFAAHNIVSSLRFIGARLTIGAVLGRADDRVKKRAGSVEYQSVDPFVRIKCAGVTADTTIVVGGGNASSDPTWEQTLDLVIKIPQGSISDIQQWVQIQNFEFFVYDSVMGIAEATRSSELIYYTAVPLIRVLLSTSKPLNAVLELTRPDCYKEPQTRPELEVSFIDKTLEAWSWTKVVDSYLSSEDIWLMKYSEKIKKDLGSLTIAFDAPNKKAAQMLEEKIWSIFITTIESLKSLFPLRNFSMILLDEYNKFRFLPAFIRPIDDLGNGLERLDDIAKAVANIPYEQTRLAPQWGTQAIISDQSDAPDYLAKWLTFGKPGSAATETFVGQIGSPSSTLIKRKGNLIEHALLLCSFFRGQHINAYVAIGQAKKRPFTWVVTVIPRSQLHNFLNAGHPALSAQSLAALPDEVEHQDTNGDYTFVQTNFLKCQTVRQEMAFKKKYSVIHWSVLSGHSYEMLDHQNVPFDVLSTIFNEKNMWFNVQPAEVCTHPTFSWDIENTSKWIPFLTNDLVIRPGKILCPYAKPTFTNQFAYEVDPVKKNHSLLKELVELIRLYRKNVLFIPSTLFYRPICSTVQQLMDARSAGLLEDTPEPPTLLGGEDQVEEGKGPAPSGSDQWWASKDPDGSLDQLCTDLVPPRHFWNGNLYQFSDNDRNSIFEHLVAAGVLDVSLPGTLFGIGVEITPKPFGMFAVRVLVGHVQDIVSPEMHHLTKL